MTEYKKQHYLPAFYLSNFSDDPTKRDRTSFVWRVDDHKKVRVPVQSQCYEDYFYSKTNPAKAEKSFHPRESAFANVMEELSRTGQLKGKNMGDLFQYMFDLNLRNAIHENMTRYEGYEAYVRRVDMFLTQMFVSVDVKKHSAEQLRAKIKFHIRKNWRMEIVRAAKDMAFVASDNPAVFVTLRILNAKPAKALQMMLLPLNPTHCALAFDRRLIEVDIQPTANELDMKSINLIQLHNARSCVYTAQEPDPQTHMFCSDYFKTRQKADCKIDSTMWSSYTIGMERQMQPSFVRVAIVL